MIEAYKVYFENGEFISVDSGKPLAMPEREEMIVTFLKKPINMNDDVMSNKQRAIFDLLDRIAEDKEELSDEFDEILKNRVNFKRELDL